ncbi:MAG: MFS transporter [Moraxellaceae bacterium]|nr:MAG: MFS transporter [Moraxellaceae bacterium]
MNAVLLAPPQQNLNNNAIKIAPAYSIGLLLSLYLAQGLPVGFLTQALPAILRQNHVSLAAIGGFGLLMAPWALKFLWAPIVDRYFSAQWGQSRSWIIPTQLFSLLLLVVISFLEPNALASPVMLLSFFIVLFLINLMGATQDIATDGLAVRLLQKQQQHWGNAVQVLGSRLGFIFGGGAVLLLLDLWSWQVVFLLLTGLVLLNSLPILLFREPVWSQQITNPVTHGASKPVFQLKQWRKFFATEFAYFWHNPQMRAWLLVLVTFKLGDSLSGAMVKPMMVDMGFSLANIGLMASMLGSVASVLGAVLAAWWMKHISRSTALWWFNLFQILSFMLYTFLAWQFEHSHKVLAWQVYSVNAIEQFAGAMALVAMLTLIMDYSRKQQAGSDFTFQVSVLAVTGGGVHIVSGVLADYWGYSIHFAFCALLAVFCVWPILRWRKLIRDGEI